ncbi:putative plasmid protein [Escherichia coli]|nr:putative plasmid protein [Escherichia coli]
MNEIDVDLGLGLNPFCFETELKIETRKKNLTVSRGTELIEKKDTGKSYFANIVHTQEVDKEEFIKLYTSQIKAYFDLTKTAYKVFFIFLRNIEDITFFFILWLKRRTERCIKLMVKPACSYS